MQSEQIACFKQDLCSKSWSPLHAQLVTGSMYTQLKRDLRQREAAGWKQVAWDLAEAPQLKQLEVVHGRLIYLNPKVGCCPCCFLACAAR